LGPKHIWRTARLNIIADDSVVPAAAREVQGRAISIGAPKAVIAFVAAKLLIIPATRNQRIVPIITKDLLVRPITADQAIIIIAASEVLFFAIARDQNIIAIITDEPLGLAAAPDQPVVATPTQEFLHGAFTSHQGIGTTCKITVAWAIIAIEILKARLCGADVKPGHETIIAGAAVKLL
jgi:hypothetical protein